MIDHKNQHSIKNIYLNRTIPQQYSLLTQIRKNLTKPSKFTREKYSIWKNVIQEHSIIAISILDPIFLELPNDSIIKQDKPGQDQSPEYSQTFICIILYIEAILFHYQELIDEMINQFAKRYIKQKFINKNIDEKLKMVQQIQNKYRNKKILSKPIKALKDILKSWYQFINRYEQQIQYTSSQAQDTRQKILYKILPQLKNHKKQEQKQLKEFVRKQHKKILNYMRKKHEPNQKNVIPQKKKKQSLENCLKDQQYLKDYIHQYFRQKNQSYSNVHRLKIYQKQQQFRFSDEYPYFQIKEFLHKVITLLQLLELQIIDYLEKQYFNQLAKTNQSNNKVSYYEDLKLSKRNNEFVLKNLDIFDFNSSRCINCVQFFHYDSRFQRQRVDSIEVIAIKQLRQFRKQKKDFIIQSINTLLNSNGGSNGGVILFGCKNIKSGFIPKGQRLDIKQIQNLLESFKNLFNSIKLASGNKKDFIYQIQFLPLKHNILKDREKIFCNYQTNSISSVSKQIMDSIYVMRVKIFAKNMSQVYLCEIDKTFYCVFKKDKQTNSFKQKQEKEKIQTYKKQKEFFYSSSLAEFRLQRAKQIFSLEQKDLLKVLRGRRTRLLGAHQGSCNNPLIHTYEA